MANNRDDYLTEYREFFERFAQTVNPKEQLPVKLGSYKFLNIEVVGGIIDWTTQYLTENAMNHLGWAPQDDVLLTVVDILKDTYEPNTFIQRDVQAKFAALQNRKDLLHYFAYVFQEADRFADNLRALSGLILKNNLTVLYDDVPAPLRLHLKDMCYKLLLDRSCEVRASTSGLITVLLLKGGLGNWLEIIPYLISLLDSPEAYVSNSAINILVSICEDHLSQTFENATSLDDPLKNLLYKFLELTSHTDVKIKNHSFKILNECLQKFYNNLKPDFNSADYLQRLIATAHDSDPETVSNVCQGFVTFIDNMDEVIVPYMNDVILYMLMKTSDANEEVAIQAGEFWFAMTKLPTCNDLLRDHLPNIVTVLLKSMRYSEYEMNILKETSGNDSEMPDRPEDVKPFAKSGEDDEDPDIGWTLRKCSAASLDCLACKYKDEIIPVAMPHIIQYLDNDDMLTKEVGILALGAIAEGCFDGLEKQLPSLIPPLIRCMENPHALIRSITCWTLSRYVKFIVEDSGYYSQTLVILMRHSLDPNKRVQRAAISSFCFLQEEAKFKLVPYIELITHYFLKGFEVYKTRSLYLLYDAIAVLAQSTGEHFKPVFNMLMEPLSKRYNSLDDYNNPEEFLAICECLSAVIAAVDVDFLPYTEMVYQKCNAIVAESVQNGFEYEDFDKDLVAGAIELVVALAGNLKSYFVKFIINSTLTENLYRIIQDESIQVRQPGLALLGEIVRLCFPYISNQIHVYIPIVIENLDIRYNGACNNAAWVIGKLCIALQKAISPYAEKIIERSMEILNRSDGLLVMYKTIAISLCILALVCPDEVLPHLPNIMRPICSTIRNVADCEEKSLAFRGLCEIVNRNSQVLVTELIFFCDAVASWNHVDMELRSQVLQIIQSFRDAWGSDNFHKVYDTFPQVLRSRMAALYGV